MPLLYIFGANPRNKWLLSSQRTSKRSITQCHICSGVTTDVPVKQNAVFSPSPIVPLHVPLCFLNLPFQTVFKKVVSEAHHGYPITPRKAVIDFILMKNIKSYANGLLLSRKCLISPFTNNLGRHLGRIPQHRKKNIEPRYYCSDQGLVCSQLHIAKTRIKVPHEVS